MPKGTYIEEELITSKAFISLSKTAMRVYMLMAMRLKKKRNKYGKKERWDLINNGELEFTYAEAENKHNIPRSTFMNAITNLVEKGFIDIEHSGSGGIKGDKNLYSISQRWKKYGTITFIFKTRPKDTRGGRGFKAFPGNRKNRRKKKTSVQKTVIEPLQFSVNE